MTLEELKIGDVLLWEDGDIHFVTSGVYFNENYNSGVVDTIFYNGVNGHFSIYSIEPDEMNDEELFVKSYNNKLISILYGGTK